MKNPIPAILALTLVASLCLAACGSTEAPAPAEETTAEESVGLVPEEGENAAYVVTVADQNGDPVPGVYVNFCTSTACSMAVSDENGVISFEGPAAVYHVDILKTPEGYSFEADEDIFTEDESCSMTLTLTKG